VKLLLADDQEALRRLLRLTLATSGVEILEASDGEQALQLARSARPDLILLDWNMPGMPGLEVARHLRHDPDTRHLHIVMLTARTQVADRRAAAEAGVRDYLTKPFSPIALLEKVREVLGPDALE
jgi:CheY-like chemotaxis protein